jgi:hypothetical protein
MKPTLLRRGMKVLCDGRTMTCVRRDKAQCCQPATCWFQCDDYCAMNGPGDNGLCTMSDARVLRPVEAAR